MTIAKETGLKTKSVKVDTVDFEGQQLRMEILVTNLGSDNYLVAERYTNQEGQRFILEQNEHDALDEYLEGLLNEVADEEADSIIVEAVTKAMEDISEENQKLGNTGETLDSEVIISSLNLGGGQVAMIPNTLTRLEDGKYMFCENNTESAEERFILNDLERQTIQSVMGEYLNSGYSTQEVSDICDTIVNSELKK